MVSTETDTNNNKSGLHFPFFSLVLVTIPAHPSPEEKQKINTWINEYLPEENFFVASYDAMKNMLDELVLSSEETKNLIEEAPDNLTIANMQALISYVRLAHHIASNSDESSTKSSVDACGIIAPFDEELINIGPFMDLAIHELGFSHICVIGLNVNFTDSLHKAAELATSSFKVFLSE